MAEIEQGEESVSELCRQYSVSRKTAYKWLKRYREKGAEGLGDRSRAPHHHPNQVAGEIEERVLELRSERPSWGPKKLWAWLEEHEPEKRWPAPSTMGEILKRHGMTRKQKKRRRAVPSAGPLSPAEGANAVWCADYKGWFVCGNGQRCYPLTISDGYSRYLLGCQALPRSETRSARRIFTAAFRNYGLPTVIRTDNGAPFATVGPTGLSRLSVWWIRLGIQPERIQPGRPQQNGQHERMHRTLKAETAQPPQYNLRAQQKLFDRFREEFNEQRPHEALDLVPPAHYYEPSPRNYPERLPELSYPAEFQTRMVDHRGAIRWDYARVFLGRGLAGEPVGLEPIGDGRWRVWYSFFEVGEFDERVDITARGKRRRSWLRLQSPSGLPTPEPATPAKE
jgi:transposase InsO family protein